MSKFTIINICYNKEVITIIIGWKKEIVHYYPISCYNLVIIGVLNYIGNKVLNNMSINKTLYFKVKTDLKTTSKINNLPKVFFAFILRLKKSYHGQFPIFCYS